LNALGEISAAVNRVNWTIMSSTNPSPTTARKPTHSAPGVLFKYR
jgi:hypothetical protein